jgi:TonB family protein
VSLATLRRFTGSCLLGVIALLAASAVVRPVPAFAQEELTRKVKSKISPVYPDIARRMNITGTVKVAVVVAPNGNIKSTKVMGGHPLLVTAAVDALKKWKFEPASDETTGTVEFKFSPQE